MLVHRIQTYPVILAMRWQTMEAWTENAQEWSSLRIQNITMADPSFKRVKAGAISSHSDSVSHSGVPTSLELRVSKTVSGGRST